MTDQPDNLIAHRSSLIVENEPLAPHTSWRIGGPARFYATPRTPDELRHTLGWAQERGLPVFVLGGGSNLLARDAGFSGLVLRYRDTSWHIDERGDAGLLRVGAGAPMAGTARRVGGLGWAGLEWAEGLPGTIGGAVYGNAGCYGGDIASVLERATLLVDGEVQTWGAERMEYGYRTSALKRDDRARTAGRSDARQNAELPPDVGRLPSRIVLAAELRLARGDRDELAATMARIAAERRSKTPWGRSCGSVFKNPPGNSAGRLIEAAGLKGATSGGAQISERHANYIVNTGGATSDDILRLIELARAAVLRQFGVELELEVVVL
jgi:UDP-N-acetylmuramate dehydrogenase